MTAIYDDAGSENTYATKEYHDRNTTGADFAYDPNGNMIKDLDRKIVTIKYNILNLPDLVQFSNGNQIVNRYAADGSKLKSDYYTQVTLLAQPITEGAVMQINPTETEHTGTVYAGNMLYEIDGNNLSLKQINNPEGYFADNNYHYYRRDHLGNNREVWCANTNSTVQRTQYYPSGLPWASNSGDNAALQPYKYAGKEFIEMHGLDEYDSQARMLYATIMRTGTIDPHAEKYYWISPYAWCFNNPLRFQDVNGKDPGDIFSSSRLAAADFGHLYNDNSIKEDKEYGSTIYRITNENGKFEGYTYTVPTVGSEHSVTPSENKESEEMQKYADVHTHGADSKGYNDNGFSKRDKADNDKDRIRGYLVSPNGSIQEYNPYTKEEVNLTNTSSEFKNIPSDQKDPSHVNNIDALSPKLEKNEPSKSTFESIFQNLIR